MLPLPRLRRETGADPGADGQPRELVFAATALSALQRIEIGDVLRPTHGTLVSYQSVFAENENWNAVEFSRHFARERFIACHARDTGEQIDSVRRTAQLNQPFGFGKVRFLEAGIPETEVIQKIDKLGCVFGRRSNQNIQISRVTRPTVEGQAVRTHDHIINAAGV